MGLANQYINKLNITPLFYSHTGFILSEQYPILDIVLNTVQNVANTSNVFHFWEGIININKGQTCIWRIIVSGMPFRARN